MLNDARPELFTRIYIRPGKTDCRMGIVGLSTLVRYQLQLNPFQKNVLFLFCGSRRNMIKALVWEGLSEAFCYPHIFWRNTYKSVF